MKGYDVSGGFMGDIGGGRYMLFASSSDYREYMEPDNEEEGVLPESA